MNDRLNFGESTIPQTGTLNEEQLEILENLKSEENNGIDLYFGVNRGSDEPLDEQLITQYKGDMQDNLESIALKILEEETSPRIYLNSSSKVRPVNARIA